MDIHIRPLLTLNEMKVAVELQKTYWGAHVESVIPAHMLFSLASYGGHVLAGFDGNDMVGVLVGFLGTSERDSDRPAMANLQIVSKRMLVLSEYRNSGIGYNLKLAQRDFALKQGVRLITWTFDPLMSINAYLNVRKLGVMCNLYLPNYYGVDNDSGLATLGSSDRLLAEWWVTTNRVEERLFGQRGALSLKQYLEAETTIINPARPFDDTFMQPNDAVAMTSGVMALLEVPTNYDRMIELQPKLAQKWREHSRDTFLTMLQTGFIVTDFMRETYQGRKRAFYLLSYNGPNSINVN